MSASTPTLESLPTEIIQRIGHFLQPRIPYPVNNKTNDSSYWVQPSTDLVRLRSTSRTLWQAVRALVGVHFGAQVRGVHEGVELAARLDAVSGQSEQGGRPNLIGGERGRVILADEATKRAIALAEGWIPPPTGPQFLIPGIRIRHFHLHVTDHGLATFHQAHQLASAIRSMPRLESFAFVFRSEVEVCEESPYRAAVMSADTFAALAQLSNLQAISLCGVKLTLRPAYGPIYDKLPDFGPALTELNLSAVHDSALLLIPAVKGLKEVHAWRDFARALRIGADEWWDDSLWETVEELDLLGWAGAQGRPMLDHLIKSIVTFQSARPAQPLPLRCLRLYEPYGFKLLFDSILPAFAGLPKLETLAVMVWRDRYFGPDVFAQIAKVAPALKELTLALENEQLNWWPGSMADHADSLAELSKLEVLTWNYTPYADITFHETQPTVLGPVQVLSSRSPQLREVRWTEQDDYLARAGPGQPWLWHRDLPLLLAPAAAHTLLAEADDDGASDAGGAGGDKENQALAPCETQAGHARPPDQAAEGRREKGKARASLGAEVVVVEGLGRGGAGEEGGSQKTKRGKGPRRSLFGDITKSATASPAGLDLGPVVKRDAGGSSQEEKEGGAGGAAEDDSGFFE